MGSELIDSDQWDRCVKEVRRKARATDAMITSALQAFMAPLRCPAYPRARVYRFLLGGWSFHVIYEPGGALRLPTPPLPSTYPTQEAAMTEAARYVAKYRRKKNQ